MRLGEGFAKGAVRFLARHDHVHRVGSRTGEGRAEGLLAVARTDRRAGSGVEVPFHRFTGAHRDGREAGFAGGGRQGIGEALVDMVL